MTVYLEEFLEIEANQITANSITEEQAVELVNGIYNIFLSWQVSSFSWNGITSIASDDADKGSDPGDTGSDKHLLDALNHDATSISVSVPVGIVLEANVMFVSSTTLKLVQST